MYRAEVCPWCENTVQLKKDGRLSRHNPLSGVSSGRDSVDLCVGSFASPVLRRVERVPARHYRELVRAAGQAFSTVLMEARAAYAREVNGG